MRVCERVFSVGFGPGLDSMSPASRRSASHTAGRGGIDGYNLHSTPPPPTVAHQPRAGCIRLGQQTLLTGSVGLGMSAM